MVFMAAFPARPRAEDIFLDANLAACAAARRDAGHARGTSLCHSGSRETAVRNPSLTIVVMDSGFAAEPVIGRAFARPVGAPRNDELQLLLPGRRGRLALLLPLLFLGAVAAVEATGGGAEHAVMSGIVTGDAADHGAFQAAFARAGEAAAIASVASVTMARADFMTRVLLKRSRH
jgi:hypothetical protein